MSVAGDIRTALVVNPYLQRDTARVRAPAGNPPTDTDDQHNNQVDGLGLQGQTRMYAVAVCVGFRQKLIH